MKPALKTAFWPCLVVAVAAVALLVLRIPAKPPNRAVAATHQGAAHDPPPAQNEQDATSLTSSGRQFTLDDCPVYETAASPAVYSPPSPQHQAATQFASTPAVDNRPVLTAEQSPAGSSESDLVDDQELADLLTADQTVESRITEIERQLDTLSGQTESEINTVENPGDFASDAVTGHEVDTPESADQLPADLLPVDTDLSTSDIEVPSAADESAPLVAEPSPSDAEPESPFPESLPAPADSVAAPEPPPQVEPAWPHATGLVEQLHEIAEYEAARDWATTVIEELELLRSTSSIDSPVTSVVLEQLAHLEQIAEQICDEAHSLELRIALLRARYALSRRLAVWRAVYATAAAGQNGVPAGELNPELLAGAVASIEDLFRNSKNYDGWCKFLLLDDLQAAARAADPTRHEARRLARRILARIESSQLGESQRKFLSGEVFVPLSNQLQLWAAEPIDHAKLLQQLEEYELRPSTALARELADQWNGLRWSPHQQVSELAVPLGSYYRNANVRLAVSEDLLNRMLPIVQDMEEDVDDSVLGSRVFGRSQTSTQLSVVLVPDEHRWRVRLEARGEVSSQTQARVGMVRLFNRGESDYLARQLLLVGRRGVELDEPEAGADAYTQLTGVRSDMDVVPLVGFLVRGIASSRHDARQDEANREVERKIAWRARRRMAEEVTARVNEAENRFDEKVLSPLQEMQLDPVATQMMTTQDRLIMRCRLAGHVQLAANTARPRAPADSLLSVQIHQSAGNNVVEQLRLDGKTYDLRELYKELAEKFRDGEVTVPDDIPEGVTLRFADEEAVDVQFSDGRALLTIRLAELDGGHRIWRDFEVRGYYRPETTTSNADLVRDGTIELIGDKLGFRDRIALRAIFCKVLSKNRKLELVHQRLVNEPRLADVRVTQFVIDNGWIGVALASRKERRDLVARPGGDDEQRR